jgi:c-di-GMP-related signal transduction protein
MIEPDAQVLNRLRELRRKGYRIALDDFVYTDSSAALLDLADFVKVDIKANSSEYIERMMPALKRCKAKLIAEKVETREQLSFCKRAGFDYFQGYFFCRPQMLSAGRTPTNRMSAVRLIATLNDPDIHIRELERIISQDVSLSYKLLRYVNSAICGLPRAVESIGHAAMLVGHKKLRIWASLILFSRLDDKPSDLIITGLVRARMCEGIAETLHTDKVDHFFLTGLFSVLDALLDRPMNEVVRSLPLPQDIVAALLDHKGRMGSVLEAVIAYEHRAWDKASFEIIDVESMRRRYVEAVNLVLNTFSILNEQPTNLAVSDYGNSARPGVN